MCVVGIRYSRMHYTRYTHASCLITSVVIWTYLYVTVMNMRRLIALYCVRCLANAFVSISVELLNFELHNDWSRLGLLIKCGTATVKTVTADPESWKTMHQVLHSPKSNLGRDMGHGEKSNKMEMNLSIVKSAFIRNEF